MPLRDRPYLIVLALWLRAMPTSADDCGVNYQTCDKAGGLCISNATCDDATRELGKAAALGMPLGGYPEKGRTKGGWFFLGERQGQGSRTPGEVLGTAVGKTIHLKKIPPIVLDPNAQQALKNATAEGSNASQQWQTANTQHDGVAVQAGKSAVLTEIQSRLGKVKLGPPLPPGAIGCQGGQTSCPPLFPMAQVGGSPLQKATAPEDNGTEPVSGANGEFYLVETDLSLPAAALPYRFQRIYRSRIDYLGPLGYGWDHNYNQRILRGPGKDCADEADYRTGQGATVHFEPGGHKPDGRIFYKVPEAAELRLIYEPKEGLPWKLEDSARIVSRFDREGLLRSITDPMGNLLRLYWEPHHGDYRLMAVVDTAQRRVVYRYDGDHLAEVSYGANRVTFHYRGDDLESVHDAKGNGPTYQYTSGVQADNSYIPTDRLASYCAVACQPKKNNCHSIDLCGDAETHARTACVAACNRQQDCDKFCGSSCQGDCTQHPGDCAACEGCTQKCAQEPDFSICDDDDKFDEACEETCDQETNKLCRLPAINDIFGNGYYNNVFTASVDQNGGDVTVQGQAYFSGGWDETVDFISGLSRGSIGLGLLSVSWLWDSTKCIFSFIPGVSCNKDTMRVAAMFMVNEQCHLCFRFGRTCAGVSGISTAGHDCKVDCAREAKLDCRARVRQANKSVLEQCHHDCGQVQNSCASGLTSACLGGCKAACADKTLCNNFCNQEFAKPQVFCEAEICQDECTTLYARKEQGVAVRSYGLPQDLNHNLVEITDVLGRRILHNEYGSDPRKFTFDRVVSQTLGEGQDNLALEYQDLTAPPLPQKQPNPNEVIGDRFDSVDVCPIACVKWGFPLKIDVPHTDLDLGRLMLVQPGDFYLAPLHDGTVQLLGAQPIHWSEGETIWSFDTALGRVDLVATGAGTSDLLLLGEVDAIDLLFAGASTLQISDSGDGPPSAQPIADELQPGQLVASSGELSLDGHLSATSLQKILFAEGQRIHGVQPQIERIGANRARIGHLPSPGELVGEMRLRDSRIGLIATEQPTQFGLIGDLTGWNGLVQDGRPARVSPDGNDLLAVQPSFEGGQFALPSEPSENHEGQICLQYEFGAAQVHAGAASAPQEPVSTLLVHGLHGIDREQFFDGRGHVLRDINRATHEVTDYNYDAFGTLIGVRAADGRRTCAINDGIGHPVRVTHLPAPGLPGEAKTALFHYREEGLSDLIVNPYQFDDTQVTHMVRRADGRPTEIVLDVDLGHQQRTTLRYDHPEYVVPSFVEAPGSTTALDGLTALGPKQATLDVGGADPIRVDVDYDSDGHATSERATGRLGTLRAFENNGLLAKVSQEKPAGGTIDTLITYDATRQPVKIDTSTLVETHQYDSQGNLQKIERTPKDGTKSTVHCLFTDASGRLDSEILPAGNVRVYAYDGAGRVTSVLQGFLGGNFDLGNNLPGWAAPCQANLQKAPQGDPSVQEVLHVDYLPGGLVSRIVHGGMAYSVVSDGHGRTIDLIDPNGTHHRTGFDRRGIAWEAVQTNNAPAYAKPVWPDASLESMVEYRRDLLGRPTRISAWKFVPGDVNRPLDLVAMEIAYDEAANQITVTQDGRTHRTTTDGLGRMIVEQLPDGSLVKRSYAKAGRRITTSAPAAVPGGTLTTMQELDAFGALAAVYDDRGTKLYEAFRDSLGRLTSEVNGAGDLRTFDYDGYGRIVQTTELGGAIQRLYTYDAGGHLSVVRDPNGNLTHLTHDGLDRLLSMTDAIGRTTTYQYASGSGRLVSRTDAAGTQMRLGYDAVGRLTDRSITDGAGLAFAGQTIVHGYSYSASGQLVRAFVDPNSSRDDLAYGSEMQFSYDSLGELIEQRSSTDPLVQTHTYNSHGEPTVSQVGQARIVRTFDAMGRLDELSLNGARIAKLDYQGIGGTTAIHYGNSANEQATYDHRGALVSLSAQLAQGNAPLYSTSEGFGLDGASRERQTKMGSGDTFTDVFQVDSATRLTAENHFAALADPPGEDMTNTDVAKYFTNQSPGSRYDLDDAGNCRSRTGVGALTTTINALNQYSEIDQKPITYDPAENLVGMSGRSYAYDGQGQLVSATVDGNTIRFGYNALGQRIVEGSGPNDITARYLWAGAELAAIGSSQNDPGAYQIEVHGDGLDRLFATAGNQGLAAPLYYHQGRDGSTVAVSDDHGLVEGYLYSAYGQPTVVQSDGKTQVQSSRVGTRHLFQGQLYDPALGTYSMRAREYDPTIGRFLSPDPIGLAGGDNLYAFVGDRPLTESDPSGLSPEPTRDCSGCSWDPETGVYTIDLTKMLPTDRLHYDAEYTVGFSVGLLGALLIQSGMRNFAFHPQSNFATGLRDGIRSAPPIDALDIIAFLPSAGYSASRVAAAEVLASAFRVKSLENGMYQAFGQGLRRQGTEFALRYMEGAEGVTSRTGQITLNSELLANLPRLREVLNHEIVHSWLSPTTGLFQSGRAALKWWGYRQSHLLRLTEEGAAMRAGSAKDFAEFSSGVRVWNRHLAKYGLRLHHFVPGHSMDGKVYKGILLMPVNYGISLSRVGIEAGLILAAEGGLMTPAALLSDSYDWGASGQVKK